MTFDRAFAGLLMLLVSAALLALLIFAATGLVEEEPQTCISGMSIDESGTTWVYPVVCS